LVFGLWSLNLRSEISKRIKTKNQESKTKDERPKSMLKAPNGMMKKSAAVILIAALFFFASENHASNNPLSTQYSVLSTQLTTHH